LSDDPQTLQDYSKVGWERKRHFPGTSPILQGTRLQRDPGKFGVAPSSSSPSLPAVPVNPIIETRDESTAPTVSLTRAFTQSFHGPQSPNTKENLMSAPSRRPEIRRRRTRAEKVAKLRKRLAAASASNSSDKDRLTAKLIRVGLVSPGNPLIKSA
jgi:hypothetical protein